MRHLLSWDALIGLCVWLFFGYMACAFFLGYYEGNRYPISDYSAADQKEIKRSINRCAIRGAIAAAIIWLLIFTNR